MRCRMCGGTGTSNICVNGTFKPCAYCGGSGKVIMTRYEYIQEYSLDELAELLAFWWCRAVICTDGDLRHADEEERARYFKEWLRQPHEV